MRAVDLYYKFRKKAGKPAVSERSLNTASLLCPDKKPEEEARRWHEKTARNTVFFLIAALLTVSFSIMLSGSNTAPISEIKRPEFGQGQGNENLEIDYGDNTYELAIPVEEKPLSPEETKALFEAARQELTISLLGENESAKRVTKKLNLSTKTSVSFVEASWQITDYRLIRYDGSLLFADDFTDGITTTVRLHLYIGEETREYPIELSLYRPTPSELSAEERIFGAIERENADKKESDVIMLPDEVSGEKVSFKKADGSISPVQAAALAAVAGALMVYMQRRRRKEELKKRKEKLELDYSELALKLSVLVGAGYSTRRALEKTAEDYRKEKEKRPKEKHYLSNELDYLLRLMNMGTPLEEVAARLGERTGVLPYMRLAGILESSEKNGRDDLIEKLETEAQSAFENRMILARRQGEKLSSRLLLPMFIQFGLIIAILIIPAFISW